MNELMHRWGPVGPDPIGMDPGQGLLREDGGILAGQPALMGANQVRAGWGEGPRVIGWQVLPLICVWGAYWEWSWIRGGAEGGGLASPIPD